MSPRAPRRTRAGSGVAGGLLALAVLLPATAVAEGPARKDVLLLYADSMLLPFNAVVDRELRSALGAKERAGDELVPAVRAALRDERYVSTSD